MAISSPPKGNAVEWAVMLCAFVAVVGMIIGIALGGAALTASNNTSDSVTRANLAAGAYTTPIAYKVGNNGSVDCAEFCNNDYWGGWVTPDGMKPAGWLGATSAPGAGLEIGGACTCKADPKYPFQNATASTMIKL